MIWSIGGRNADDRRPQSERGANDRSGDYVEQLKMYADALVRDHNREETVGGLQIWYLGHPSIKTVPVPSVEDMGDEKDENALGRTQRQHASLIDCPPEPRAMRGFSPAVFNRGSLNHTM